MGRDVLIKIVLVMMLLAFISNGGKHQFYNTVTALQTAAHRYIHHEGLVPDTLLSATSYVMPSRSEDTYLF